MTRGANGGTKMCLFHGKSEMSHPTGWGYWVVYVILANCEKDEALPDTDPPR